MIWRETRRKKHRRSDYPAMWVATRIGAVNWRELETMRRGCGVVTRIDVRFGKRSLRRSNGETASHDWIISALVVRVDLTHRSYGLFIAAISATFLERPADIAISSLHFFPADLRLLAMQKGSRVSENFFFPDYIHAIAFFFNVTARTRGKAIIPCFMIDLGDSSVSFVCREQDTEKIWSNLPTFFSVLAHIPSNNIRLRARITIDASRLTI